LYSCKKKELPSIKTIEAYSITKDGAKSGGIITSDGNAWVRLRGVVCSSRSDPDIETNERITHDAFLGKDNTGAYSSEIVDLTPDTHYYVRAYATNSVGTAYGEEFRFATLPDIKGIYFNPDLVYDSIVDVEGNVYKTIRIGTQTWMAENLRATEYNDGRSIPEVALPDDWIPLTSPAYCWAGSEFELSNKKIYGAWYNYYAVENGNLCPSSWHVPTVIEWNTLLNYLEPSTADIKLREVGTTHWPGPNIRATNESGFTALPGGGRFEQIDDNPGTDGIWWGTPFPSVFIMSLSKCFVTQLTNSTKKIGFSVRCVKDYLTFKKK
jgi:uncharacterized protein (TIGR02145 family)